MFDADNVNAVPAHTGPLFDATGAAGVVGVVRITVATAFETQPFCTTKIFV